MARSCSEGVSGEGSGDSTLGAETPNRFDAEKWQKQKQKEMDKKRQLKLEANRIRRKNRAKEKKKTLADNLIYYDQDALERGVPMRYVLHGSLELKMALFRVKNESQTLLKKVP